MQHLSPFLRSPFTDITGGLVSHQLFGRCAQQEMEMMDCLEAYGLDRGIPKCKCLIEDFKECQTLTKQYKRYMAMQRERQKQIKCGKLDKSNSYLNPEIHGY